MSTSEKVELSDKDLIGPVPTELVTQIDYYLILSWAIIFYSLAFGCYKYSAPLANFYRRINIFNYEQVHLD